MPRLFISHSSRDNVAALGFQRWLAAQGWSAEDIFIDLHGIGAGERWRDTLRKANASCEAVLLLASPDSLDSQECQRELNLAEDLGKEIIVAMLRDLKVGDPRLARWADRQIVDLSAEPQERMEPFEHAGVLQRVHFHAPALNAIAARLAHLGIAPGSFAWTPRKLADGTDEGPYPGLASFGEEDAGIFFGREADIMAGLTRLRRLRKQRSPRLLVIQAASGAGKSSYLRAGLWPRLKRDPDFAPLAIVRPALGIISGPEGLGRGIAPFFARHGRTKVPGDISAALVGRVDEGDPTRSHASGDVGSRASTRPTLADLIAEATALATQARRAGAPDARPPAPIIAIDQGEELFAPENAAESERFLGMLAAVLKEPPALTSGRVERGASEQPEYVDPYVLITIRVDSVEPLLQRWPALGLDAPETQVLPPLGTSAYRDVIVKPAEVYTDRVRRLDVEPALVDQLARDATGADALPLLAFTLEKLFHEFGADGGLTLARYEGLGGVGGSIDRALALAQKQAGPVGTLDHLRRLMVPGLATWDPAANAAKRLPANEAELLGSDPAGLTPSADGMRNKGSRNKGSDPQGLTPARAHLKPLADALVANRLLTRNAADQGKAPVTLEVAHEALLRRAPIDGWLAEQKDDLALRDNVVKEARDWVNDKKYADKRVLLLRSGERLQNALMLAANPDYAGAMATASDYLEACNRLDRAGRRRARLVSASIMSLMALVIAGMTARMYERELSGLWFQFAKVRPNLVTAEAALALPKGKPFWDCAKTAADYSALCPGMVVLPPGEFTMGSPETEKDRSNSEGPQRKVTIKAPLAVGVHEVTFDQWDQCVAAGGCKTVASDSGWPRGRWPVINVNWHDAQEYAAWLSRMTGHTYRLLTEAEWEYAARAGSQARWSFGDDGGKLGDHAWFASNSESKTQPVGGKQPNAFGLYDMHGNVFEWVQDCYVDGYKNAPTDGTAVSGENDCNRVVRGGSWYSIPRNLRAAYRSGYEPDNRFSSFGFRVARVFP